SSTLGCGAIPPPLRRRRSSLRSASASRCCSSTSGRTCCHPSPRPFPGQRHRHKKASKPTQSPPTQCPDPSSFPPVARRVNGELARVGFDSSVKRRHGQFVVG